MTRMSDDSERQRETIENALALIARARVIMRTQIILRLRQAIQRGYGDLLSPALEYADLIDRALATSQDVLGVIWRRGERAGWK